MVADTADAAVAQTNTVVTDKRPLNGGVIQSHTAAGVGAVGNTLILAGIFFVTDCKGTAIINIPGDFSGSHGDTPVTADCTTDFIL